MKACLTEYGRSLVAAHAGAAGLAAEAFARRRPGLQIDWLSHAYSGLVDAALAFDPGRGLKFWTFAVPRVNGAMLDALRQEASHSPGMRTRAGRLLPDVVSLDAPHFGAETSRGPVRLADQIEDGGPPVGWEIEWEQEVAALSRKTNRRAGEALRLNLLHADCATMEATGREMGLSGPRVSQLLAEARRDLAATV